MSRLTIALLASVALAGVAHAADLVVAPASVPAATADTDTDWTGFYAGGQLGFFSGNASWTNVTPSTIGSEASPQAASFGVVGGYNLDLGSVVVGVSGQYNVTDASASAGFNVPAGTVTYDVTGFGSIDGRVGLDLGNFLPYLVGGAGAATLDVYYDGIPPEDYAPETLWGWSVGIGADLALTDTLVGRLEYRHADYGSKEITSEVTLPGALHDIALTSDTVTVGLSYRF